MNLYKTCRMCGEERPLDFFDTKFDAADGKHPYCKDCRRELRGSTPRKPPKLAEVDDSLVEQVEAKISPKPKSRLRDKLKAKNATQNEEISYAQIVAETLVYANHPAMQKKRKVRNTAERIVEQPVLNFEKKEWDQTDEDRADAIYDAWEKRQKQDQERYKEINKRLPIATKKNQKNYEMRQGHSFEIFAQYEEGTSDSEDE